MLELMKRAPKAATSSKNSALQPILFKSQDRYFIKADSTAIHISDCSCFVEAVQFLFMTFYVFNVSYPFELRFFYGCLEMITGLESSVGRSFQLTDLFRQLKAAVTPR